MGARVYRLEFGSRPRIRERRGGDAWGGSAQTQCVLAIRLGSTRCFCRGLG